MARIRRQRIKDLKNYEAERPLCSCHGVPQTKHLQHWTCSVKAEETRQRYLARHSERARDLANKSRTRRREKLRIENRCVQCGQKKRVRRVNT